MIRVEQMPAQRDSGADGRRRERAEQICAAILAFGATAGFDAAATLSGTLRALRAERRRARGGARDYDPERHLALLQASRTLAAGAAETDEAARRGRPRDT
jgi:hypothetical protein